MPFALVPEELALQILLVAADDDRATALNVSRVSKDIHKWTLPCLYHSIHLASTLSVTRLNHSLTNNPALACLVRHLAIFALGPLPTIQQLILALPRVVSLVAGFPLSRVQEPELAEPLKLPHVREQHFLGMSCRDGLPHVLTPSLIPPHTTHLRIHLPISAPEALSSLVDLPGTIPSLTHLAFIWRNKTGVDVQSEHLASLLDDLLARDHNLVVLLLQCDRGMDVWNERALSSTGDIRLVAESVPPSTLEWEAGCTYSTTWASAEAHVAERRQQRHLH